MRTVRLSLCLRRFFPELISVFFFWFPRRLMELKLDPSILPPTPHCPAAREANRLEEAAAEASKHTSPSVNPTLLLLLLLTLFDSPLRFYKTVQAHKQFVNPSLSMAPFFYPSIPPSLCLSAMSFLSLLTIHQVDRKSVV